MIFNYSSNDLLENFFWTCEVRNDNLLLFDRETEIGRSKLTRPNTDEMHLVNAISF